MFEEKGTLIVVVMFALTLYRQRMYEQQRDQMMNQQFNIDQTSFAIETIKSTQTTVAAMKEASKTLKKEQKKINLNDLENMQDDMEGILLVLFNLSFCLTIALCRFAGRRW